MRAFFSVIASNIKMHYIIISYALQRIPGDCWLNGWKAGWSVGWKVGKFTVYAAKKYYSLK
jgi:hypothetical protein